jgi:hypothetical protein
MIIITIKMIELRRMKWAGNVACMREKEEEWV